MDGPERLTRSRVHNQIPGFPCLPVKTFDNGFRDGVQGNPFRLSLPLLRMTRDDDNTFPQVYPVLAKAENLPGSAPRVKKKGQNVLNVVPTLV